MLPAALQRESQHWQGEQLLQPAVHYRFSCLALPEPAAVNAVVHMEAAEMPYLGYTTLSPGEETA